VAFASEVGFRAGGLSVRIAQTVLMATNVRITTTEGLQRLAAAISAVSPVLTFIGTLVTAYLTHLKPGIK
jgi:hypothetical protein